MNVPHKQRKTRFEVFGVKVLFPIPGSFSTRPANKQKQRQEAGRPLAPPARASGAALSSPCPASGLRHERRAEWMRKVRFQSAAGCVSVSGLWLITRGLFNHCCDTFGNFPFYIEGSSWGLALSEVDSISRSPDQFQTVQRLGVRSRPVLVHLALIMTVDSQQYCM